MEKCKFCQQELAEDSTICPHCGKDNAAEVTEEEARQASPVEETAAAAPEAEVNPSEEEKVPAEENVSAEATEEENASAEAEAPAEETQEEKPQEPKKKASAGQIALAVGTIVVLAAILIALIISALGDKKEDVQAPVADPTQQETVAETTEPAPTTEPTIPADGNPEDVTCKGTYTVTDEEAIAAADEVIGHIAEYELTNAQFQVQYWKSVQNFFQSDPYAAYMVDMTIPFEKQACPLVEGWTWQQFFVDNALKSWQNYQSMAAEAEANGMKVSAELQKYLRELPGQLEEQAKANGFADAAALLASNFGAGMDMDDYVKFMEIYNQGYGFFGHFLEVAKPDDAKLEQFYTEHQKELEEGGISKDAKAVNVRHILISTEDPEDEAGVKAAREKAESILKTFTEGDKSEESFGKLATENTQDPGSQQNGGLYENVIQGQMVPEFDAWCFDDSRKPGDTGIVQTDFGFHVMYYSGDHLIWKEQVSQIYLNEEVAKLMDRNTARYPMVVDYSKIVIGNPVAQG